LDPAHKDGGSRQHGRELLQERLMNAMKPEGPRLFVFSHCRQFIRTVPTLPREEIDMNDADSKAEDHVGGWDSNCGIREEGSAAAPGERKKAGSAAAPCVAFPAEHKVLES
jgi:hypothetical protein